MTKKQMRKLAKEIYECEKIHDSKTSSQEEKSRAEKRIIQISNQIGCLKNGMEIMTILDDMIQELNSKNNIKGE